MRWFGSDIGTESRLDARETDGMRAHAELLLEMTKVLHHREDLETPVVEPKQNAHADVVDARFHRPVEDCRAPIVIALQAFQVNLRIGGAMIGLLEKLEGAN